MVNYLTMVEPLRKFRTPYEAFKAVGLPSDFYVPAREAICRSRSLEDLEPLRLKIMPGGDTDQFLLPLFRPLYERLNGFRESALKNLGPQPLNEAELDWYFTQLGDQPLPILGIEMGHRFTDELGDQFVSSTRQTMLVMLKQTLCGQ